MGSHTAYGDLDTEQTDAKDRSDTKIPICNIAECGERLNICPDVSENVAAHSRICQSRHGAAAKRWQLATPHRPSLGCSRRGGRWVHLPRAGWLVRPLVCRHQTEVSPVYRPPSDECQRGAAAGKSRYMDWRGGLTHRRQLSHRNITCNLAATDGYHLT